jgi:hypothetical protein
MTSVMLLAGERCQGETTTAIKACNAYLRMENGRSLVKLLEAWERSSKKPLTRQLSTLKEWSRLYGWVARAETYDTEIEKEREAEHRRQRKQVFEDGLALDYERVRLMKVQAQKLIDLIEEPDPAGGHPLNVMLRDAKGIGSGEDFERFDVERFNAPIFEQLRGLLEDIAKEKGERRQGVDHRGAVALVTVTADDLAAARKRAREYEEQLLDG